MIKKLLLIAVAFVLMQQVNAQNWNQVIKAAANDRGSGDQFGYSVAISGDYAIVGAPNEFEDASGGNTIAYAGSVYIFKNTAGTWAQVQKLVAADRGSYDQFGFSVAISGDYAIVGAPYEDEDASGLNTLSAAGSAYIFKNTAGTWAQVKKVVAADRASADLFGYSVAISGDYAIVGAYGEDEDAIGGSTTSGAGSAYLFKNTAGTWGQVQKVVASDRASNDAFGRSVAISGDYAIVGAPAEDENTYGGNTISGAGSAYIFKNTAGTWAQVKKVVASYRYVNDQFGYSVAINGDYAIVGVPYANVIVSGGFSLTDAGSAYIFKNTAGTWAQVKKVVTADLASYDYFGYSVAISGETAIVGAYSEAEDANGLNTLSAAGSAYLFKNTAGTWAQDQKVVASDRAISDNFGRSVAISGAYAIVGASQEDEDASGGNTLSNAGSAYIFAGPSPQLSVSGNGQAIPNNGTPMASNNTYLGQGVLNTAIVKTYTLTNSGTASLDLTGSPLVALSGSADFSVSTQPAVTTLASGASTTFEMSFTPTASGLQSATVSIASTDASSPFTFTISGGLPTSSGVSTALDFVGGAAGYLDRISGVETGLPSGNQARTVEMWIKASAASFPATPFLFKYGTNNANELARFSLVNSDYSGTNNGKVFFTSLGVTVTSNGKIMDSQWHHIAYVYDGASTVTLYIDGNFDVSSSSFSSLNTILGSGFLINEGDYNSHSWSGTLDDFKVWDRALSQSEIQSSKNGCLSVNSPNLVLFYNFEEGIPEGDNSVGSGNYITQVDNVAGTGLNGTLNGFALTGTSSNFVTGQTFDQANTCGPIVAMSGNSQTIVNGATPQEANHTSFGRLASGNALERTFTIWNTGSEDVVLNGATSVSKSGSSDFAVTAQPALTTIPPGGSTIFKVTFTPTASGLQSAQLSIASSDPRAPFSFEVSGSTNTAINFDRSGDYIDLGFQLPATYTKEAWVRITAQGIATQVQNNIISGTVEQHAFWIPNDANGGYLGYNLSAGHNGTWSYVKDPVAIVQDVWYHVAVSYDASTQEMKLYKNGVLVSSASSVPNFIGTGRINIGAYYNTSFIGGDVDEVRIWNRVLCQAEIQGRMNSSLQGNENGLLAYYDFEEGAPGGTNTSLTEVKDKANNHHGTLYAFAKTGATSNWVDGIRLVNENIAMDFDGVDDYVSVPHIGALSLTTFTIEAWVKTTQNAAHARVVTKAAGAGGQNYSLLVNAGKAQIRFDDGIGGRQAEGTTSIDDGKWHFISGTFSNADNLLIIYVDGVAENQLITAGIPILDTKDLNIGKYGAAYPTSGLFVGQIDETRVWNTARTAQEINDNMFTTLSGTEAGLVAYYDFQEGVPNGINTGLTSIVDKAGGNNGTLSGFAKTGTSSNWVNGTTAIDEGTVNGTLKTWLGTTTDWNTATNWTPNGIPDQCTDVVIPVTANDPTFSDNQAVNSIEIQTGATLTVGAGGCLWVGSSFTNNGDFILNATSSTYAQYLGPQVVGTLQQVFGEAGWHTIASPFIDATLDDIVFDHGAFLQYGAPSQCNIQYYDPGVYQASPPGAWSNAWASWVCATNGTDPFDGSRAYNIFFDDYFVNGSFSEVKMSVTGTLRNMPLTQQLNGANGGWNQLSNPFPSVIDWEKWNDNSAINNTYYVWDATSQSYYTYMAGGTSVPAATLTAYIAPYQSVFVKTTNGATTNPGSDEPDVFQDMLTSNADRPTTCPVAINNFYKTVVTGELHLETKTQNYTDELAIRFGNGFSEGYKNNEEAVKFFSPNKKVPSIYTLIEDRAFVISSYPQPGSTVQSIPLGLQTKVGQSISWVATEIPEGVTAILEDKLEKTFTNLKKAYHFSSTKSVDNNRFVLHLGDAYFTTNDISGSDDLIGFVKDNELRFINNPALEGGAIEILNMAIQSVAKAEYSKDTRIDVSGYAAGVYLIVVKKRGEVFRQKIIIQ